MSTMKNSNTLVSPEEKRLLNRALRAINQCNQVLIHAVDEQELLNKICRIVVEIGGYRMAWVSYAEHDKEKSICPVAQAGFDEGYLKTIHISWADVDSGRGPTGTAIRTGTSSYSRDVMTDPLFARWSKEALMRGYASALSLPLKADQIAFGALTIYSSSPEAFDSKETELLTALADNLAYGITMLRSRKAHALAVEELRQSELRYRSLFQNKHSIMLIINQHDGTIVDANPAAVSYYGWSHADLCQMNIKQINQLSDDEIQAEMQQASAEKRNYFLFRHRLADGSIHDVEVYSAPITIEHKSLLYSIVNDITERKKAQQKLLENQKRFTQALEAAHAGVWDADLKTGENIWSDEVWELYGLERGKTKSSIQLWQTSIHPDDQKQVIQLVANAVQKAIPINIEYRVIHLDGTVHWLMSKGMPLFDDQGDAVRYIGTCIDITDRKQIELDREKLLEWQAGFNTVLEIRHIGYWELDLLSNTVHRSIEHARIFGYDSNKEDWKYETFLDHVIPEDRAEVDRQFKKAVATHADWNIECRIRRADGQVRWIWAVGGYQFDKNNQIRLVSGITQDITKRKHQEEEKISLELQLQQAQKMQLVGRLAGGIAHDFNNMLTVILGHTELALAKADATLDDLEAIQNAAIHSAELTRQLLAFARRQTVSVQIIDLNASVEGMLPLLRRLIGEHISLIWIPKIQDGFVKLDPAQINQIFTNLCVNARDAIVENGKITIETDKIHVEQAMCKSGHPCTIPGDYISLTITDNGQGIDKKDLPHILEPFYTTKAVGKGTGMGLATVYGIVKQSNGFLDIQSKIGEGTTFSIYLPLQRNHIVPGDEVIDESPLQQGTATILLVEDQPDILRLCRKLLEHKNYSVLTAAGPVEAIELTERNSGKIDLLVTDVFMPQMNGNDLYKKLQKSCPKLHVLYMSGYTADFIGQHLTGDEWMNFIEKPFSTTSFTLIVQDILKKEPEK